VESLHEENLRGDNTFIMQSAAATGEVFTAYYDAIESGDTEALEQYQEHARAGDYGRIQQVLAETGDYWGETSIGEAAEEVWDGIEYLTEDWF
jgi:hypothetical protein